MLPQTDPNYGIFLERSLLKAGLVSTDHLKNIRKLYRQERDGIPYEPETPSSAGTGLWKYLTGSGTLV